MKKILSSIKWQLMGICIFLVASTTIVIVLFSQGLVENEINMRTEDQLKDESLLIETT